MSYEKIYDAAIKQNNDELQQAIGSGCINESAKGVYLFSAISQLAMEKNIIAVEFLIKHGANINYAAHGAAIGGHQNYVESLIKRGADINWAAEGAATGGHQDFAEALIKRGANINYVAKGLAIGGYQDFAEALIKRGADIDLVANGAAIGGHQDFAENLLKRGADINLVARGAAIGGHQDFAEAFIKRGAAINSVAYGAGMGGHQDFAEALIKCGANINYVAKGLAIGGHQDFAEALIKRGANISSVALGAASGGHQYWAETLIKRGADINSVACGAAIGGYQDFAEALIKRGADINSVAYGAARNEHISKRKGSQLAYLSLHQPDTIPDLVTAFKKLEPSIIIDETTEKKAIAISKNIHKNKLNYSQALARTDPACNGMLFLLMLLVMKGSIPTSDHTVPILLPEIWRHIFNFIVPMELDENDFENLGFVTGRTYLRAQLSSYQSGWGKHHERALSFFQAVSDTRNKTEMQDLISKQVDLLQGKNPYRLLERDKKYKMNSTNAIPDKYYGIVGFWEKIRTGQPVVFKDEELSSSPYCSIL